MNGTYAPTPQVNKADKTACPDLGRDEALAFLAAFSSAPATQRISLTYGPARAVYEEEAAFVREGWPPAFMQGWTSAAWKDVSVRHGEKVTLLELQHGTSLEKATTRFELICDKSWVVQQVGTNDRWYTPSPTQLTGQDGELTEALALELARDTLMNYGTTRMRVSATGPELERGRQLAIAVAGGASLSPQIWDGLGTRLTLTHENADRAIGHWVDKGTATGDKLLFERVNGLWKVADHTEGGHWAPAQRPGFDEPRGLSSDLYLLGLELGMTKSAVEQLAGKPNQVKDRTYVYQARKLTVTFDENGNVVRIEAKTGATWRGLRVGDSRDTAISLYGKPGREASDSLTYTEGPLRLTVRLTDEAGGTRQVEALALERLR